MSDKSKELKKQELELIKETELFMEEVYKDPDVANAKVPPTLRERVFEEIRAREAEKAKRAREMLCNEDKELIRLGKIYKKRRKARKYLVLAAVLVFVVAFGITSIGDAEKIFETFKIMTMGREQTQLNSNEDVREETDWSEDKAYEEVEEQFEFLPVKLNYLPEGIAFLEAEVSEETQNIYMLYGTEKDVNISYQIRPNYRQSSWGKDIEDELLGEFKMSVNDIEVQVKEYRVTENIKRWLVGFEYQNTSYSMLIMDLEQIEVEKIIKGFYFR